MNSKEIIKRCLEFNTPERIGLDFNAPHQSDILWIKAAELKSTNDSGYDDLTDWGCHEELLRKVPKFKGEVMVDEWGTIHGRLDHLTKGEPIKGALEDGWEAMDEYTFPEIDTGYYARIKDRLDQNSDKFLLGAMPCSPFATMRDMRRMDNLFIDLLTEEEKVLSLNEKIEELMVRTIEACAGNGFDGIVIYEDWGIQNTLLINPNLWRRIFKPIYKRLIEFTHMQGLKFFIHSCGYVYDIIEDLIDAGVDVFQFDQPELVGIEKLSQEFGGRVTFWCPVDIQKVMVTGDRSLIESAARKMLQCFGRFNGGFIAKDYPQWDAIEVKDEWAQWARDVFIREIIMEKKDFFANIANGQQQVEREDMQESSPGKLESLVFPLSCSSCERLEEKSYEEQVIDYRGDLDKLKAHYKPFLNDFVPKAKTIRKKVDLTDFQFRFECPEDQKDLSRVMNGCGEWENIRLPDYRGPVGKWTGYYRTVLRCERPRPGRKMFLKFFGVDYIANVYLNNRFIGSHEGFFAVFEFDITDNLHMDGENVLVIEVRNDIPTIGLEDEKLCGDKIYACTGPGWDDPKDGWHHCPPGAGIYDKVILEERPEVFVDSIFIRPDIDNAQIEARIQVFNTKAENDDIRLDLSIYPRNFQAESINNVLIDRIEPAGPGMNYYRFVLKIPNFKLWQCDEPWLYTARVRVQSADLDGRTADEPDANGEGFIDEADAIFGMRKFHMDEESDEKGSLYLNNQPVFLRGANDMGHMQQCVMNSDFEQLVEDILIAKLANMNYYRFTQRPVQQEIYQYSDMLGMMNQTDLPLFGYLRRNQFCEALRQTGEMEQHIRNHPSAIMVTYINEPFPVVSHKMGHRHLFRDELEAFFEAADRVVKVENPDRVIKHVEGDYDPPTGTGLSDFHCYNLWYTNHAIPFGKLYKGYLPALKKGWKTGCGEYGTEGLDNEDVMIRRYPKEWLPDEHSGKWTSDRIVLSQTNSMHGDWYEEQDNIEDWIRESQKHQAFATKVMTDALRRRSDRIVSTAVHLLIDAWPAGWMKALVGVDRVPKPAYFSFKDSLEPVRVHLRCDRWKAYSGELIEVEVWGLNDYPWDYQGCKIIATLRDDARDYASFEMTCDIQASCSKHIGMLKMSIPEVKDRKQFYIDIQLLNNQEEIINVERFHMEAFEKTTTAKNDTVIATIGESARQMLDSLAIPNFHAEVLSQQNLSFYQDISSRKVNCIFISDAGEYERYRQQVERFVEEGGTAVFIASGQAGERWKFADTEVRCKNIFEGGYVDGIDSQAVNGLYFVARDREHPLTCEFLPNDFSYWYSTGSNRIDFIATKYLESEKLHPLLYTYEKPAFAKAAEGGKRKRPVVGVKKHGKGKAFFLSLCLEGRTGSNPVLERLILKLCGIIYDQR